MERIEGGFGLYLHWPFCQSKCPYCDFNSHVASEVDQGRWLRAYLAEIDRSLAETRGRLLQSVFFGGGTPSLMAPATVAAILERIRRSWTVANDWEVTLEANPGSVEAGKFLGFRDAGVNRLSMGLQALNDADLKRLGRLHSVAEAERALDIARQHFERVSFDLIYARQDQTPEAWRAELGRALAMTADHLSLYQLTIEDGTAFGDRHARGKLRGLPDEDRSVALYDITQELCDAAGLPAYEVSNHAGSDAQSRHNLIYWRGGDYVGIGPGAHGRLSLGGTAVCDGGVARARSLACRGRRRRDRGSAAGGDVGGCAGRGIPDDGPAAWRGHIVAALAAMKGGALDGSALRAWWIWASLKRKARCCARRGADACC